MEKYINVSPEEFPSQLKELRQSKSMTQKDLAEKAGVTQQTISAIEGGRLDPSFKLLLTILAVLGGMLLISTLFKKGEE